MSTREGERGKREREIEQESEKERETTIEREREAEEHRQAHSSSQSKVQAEWHGICSFVRFPSSFCFVSESLLASTPLCLITVRRMEAVRLVSLCWHTGCHPRVCKRQREKPCWRRRAGKTKTKALPWRLFFSLFSLSRALSSIRVRRR